MAMARARYK